MNSPAQPFISTFEGGNALSSFRVLQLLPKLQAINPNISHVSAHFVHLAATDGAPDAALQTKLQSLLTYGEPAQKSDIADGSLKIIVAPRLGTVSPWASKASDIAHNCGLAVKRIERMTEYVLAVKGTAALSAAEIQSISAILHDRMACVGKWHRVWIARIEPIPTHHVDSLWAGQGPTAKAFGIGLLQCYS